MTQIGQDAARAFLAKEQFKRGNTRVALTCELLTYPIGAELYLHENKIAEIHNTRVWISNSHWPTRTTKNRLDEILSQLGNPGYILTEGNNWFYRSKNSRGQITETSMQNGNFVRIK